MKKNSLLKFVFWVFTLLLILCATLELTSCSTRHKSVDVYLQNNDSIEQVKQLNYYFNPTFTNVDEVLKYKLRVEKADIDDSIIRHIPNETLINISTVLVNKNKQFTKSDIVDEYLKSQTVYDNLPSTKDLQRDTSQTVSTKDTIINGEKTKIIIKMLTINKNNGK